MVHVTGTVHDVSDNPDRVEKVIVRAAEPRMHGTTYITEESAQFLVVDGVLDFEVLPGPCVVAFLRHHGATTYEKLLVPDTANATFKECLEAGNLAEEGDRSALEKVVRQIQDELAKTAPLVDEVRTLHTEVSNDRTAVDGFAKAAQSSAAEAATSESNAKGYETTAGDYAAVATTAATEAVDAMGRVTEVVDADYATQSDLSSAVANSLRVDTTLTTWTADAVGGRNLLQGSSAEPTEFNLAATSYYRDITGDTLLEVGQEYTFSVIVDKLSDDDHPVSIQLGTGTGSNYTRDITGRSIVTSGERMIITFAPTEYHLEGRTHFAWRIRNERNETTVAYREAKLERGYKATSWTPAPEDSVQSLLGDDPLPSPFPGTDPDLALRVDNSVGTRVFVGDTMIHGDTGWRDVTDSYLAMQEATGNVLTLGEGARILVRRTGESLIFGFQGPISASRNWTNMFQLTSWFRPDFEQSVGMPFGGRLERNGAWMRLMGIPEGTLASEGKTAIAVFPVTATNWPGSLPGTPA